ncbi:Tfp pilus assembly protein FimT/FimU [Rodentibacter caecimuris]|uniref:Prepilin-type N-terminal cleavage/methylation domain-containing protein n=1 Tax=Rodentibacter caecimuris TaxID=1796644 RepID=A0ABX3KYC6_9PAST|nr:prepilin-type N-terminal cleavage/methylation domain-containing protein [Rodentibacter heylii]
MHHRGFTLVEILIILTLVSLCFSFTIPKWRSYDAQFILAKEEQRLYLFLRNIQARAENSSSIWFILVSTDPIHKRWCITAQVKNEKLCNCLYPQYCPSSLYAHFYYPYFPQKTTLHSEKQYPLEIARFSGIRNTIVANCFVLQAEKYRTLFSFFNVGTINLKKSQATSACNNRTEE